MRRCLAGALALAFTATVWQLRPQAPPAVPNGRVSLTAGLPVHHAEPAPGVTTTTLDWRPYVRGVLAARARQLRIGEAIEWAAGLQQAGEARRLEAVHHTHAIPARPTADSQSPHNACPYAGLIRQVWSRDAEWAISVAWSRPGHPYGESHCVPTAANPSGCRGLFAICQPMHDNWFTLAGCTPAQWADPTCAVKAAWRGYELNGRGPWA